LYVDVSPGSGHFEVTEGESIVISGRIAILTIHESSVDDVPTPVLDAGSLPLNSDEFYKEMWLLGYEYAKEFRGMLLTDGTGNFGFFNIA